MLIVFTTVPNRDQGEALAGKLVERRLAACVQLLPEMTSFYVWEAAIQREPEHLLLIKTTNEKWEALQDFLAKEHSYTVPEIVAIEAASISGPYSEWLSSAVG